MRQKFTNEESAERLLFFLSAFVVHFLTSVIILISFHEGNNSNMIAMQMLYPAAGVILAAIVVKRYMTIPWKFFISFLLITVLNILFRILSILFTEMDLQSAMNIFFSLSSLILLAALGLEGKEVRQLWGLDYNTKKHRHPCIFIGLFLLLLIVRDFLVEFFAGNVSNYISFLTSKEVLFHIMLFPFLFLLNFANGFGEEYGWRYYLQPYFQKKYGKRAGVILLGLVWSFWHLPYAFLAFNIHDILVNMVGYIVTCMSFAIFLGYVYMKTENIWIVIVLHMINNLLAPLLVDISLTSWKSVGIMLAANMVCFMPFIFSETFRED